MKFFTYSYLYGPMWRVSMVDYRELIGSVVIL